MDEDWRPLARGCGRYLLAGYEWRRVFLNVSLENTVSIAERPSISCNAKHISDDVSSRVRIQQPIGWPWRETREAIVKLTTNVYNSCAEKAQSQKCVTDMLTDKIGPLVSRVRLPPGTSRAIPAIYELLASPENDGLTRKRAEALNEVCFALARESRDRFVASIRKWRTTLWLSRETLPRRPSAECVSDYPLPLDCSPCPRSNIFLEVGFKHGLFSPLFGEYSHFD